jgi:DMSO/TMAO reductase YedYZ molybdopterin-dependent catalytic subunit
MDIPRRQFMFLALGALMRADDLQKRDLLTRSARPEDLEMPLSGFADYITPIDRFFVRTHVAVPTVNLALWRLNVEGEVTAPLTLTMQDVKGLPSVELMAVAECAGNGRRFYDPPVPGVQWGNGAVGNGRWRGVRLPDVLRKAGIKASAREVLLNGADVPLGMMPDFERSIPIKKALDPNTLLAYEMNGEPLPVKHGFPLRAIVPGWAGDSWTKWVTSIRVLDREYEGFWMKRAYRHPGKPVVPGTPIEPERMQPVTSLRVKSVIAAPADGAFLPVGAPVVIRGAAWSGDAGPVEAVDVSVDGGRRWRPATLHRDQRTPFGWRQWEFEWTPSQDAYYTLLARARDTTAIRSRVESLRRWMECRPAYEAQRRTRVARRAGAGGNCTSGLRDHCRPARLVQEQLRRLPRRGSHPTAAPYTSRLGSRDQQDDRLGRKADR